MTREKTYLLMKVKELKSLAALTEKQIDDLSKVMLDYTKIEVLEAVKVLEKGGSIKINSEIIRIKK